MLTQILIDMLVQLVALGISMIPPLPPEAGAVLAQIAGGFSYLAELVAKFGIIVPLNVVTGIIGTWAGLMGFWFVMLLVRIFLMAMGR